ncbi:MAG: 16S rRNA (cytidine(1402)-2'-O)-methyltransferase [Pseudomonadota bacterium]|nr:16S rRNA (cytidine(1402)-2'-O)-methyltransferase [Pseudomonadota bacterium]MEC7560373.1 16S rRNA (cytidine(1402)-2'-O)-methyltransferase [Pseudomonadota bacterium]MEC7956823.1 16S rRNA (cytidine(1402)-2'-O)-methyltransferase [Pseudomonadota bacterium]MEC8047084.1 16S rRNA (cytidine(1402)-2'-O)-methyltransferase [Pseudomonadota bacterium]MEC8500741.1 16S rRNA (cytidine(1402)-2'-O)-methyltransferase [Pseudomonadota bacterium]
MSGTLYVVATPIGHLGDLSQRAVATLKQVEIIAAEDTRRSGVLLTHIGHQGCQMVSLHDHNEATVSPKLITRLKMGDSVALVSDAGTPLINDPGYRLLQLAWQQDIQVVPIPGPSAVITALSVCPLPSQPFRYVGFLAAKASARRQQLQTWLQHADALVFFESPHRIRHTLEDLGGLTQRRIFLGREMTKQYETFLIGSAEDVLQKLGDPPKGEFVGIVEAGDAAQTQYQHQQVLQVLLQELSPAKAARLAAQICGANKRDLYELALTLNANNAPS